LGLSGFKLALLLTITGFVLWQVGINGCGRGPGLGGAPSYRHTTQAVRNAQSRAAHVPENVVSNKFAPIIIVRRRRKRMQNTEDIKEIRVFVPEESPAVLSGDAARMPIQIRKV